MSVRSLREYCQQTTARRQDDDRISVRYCFSIFAPRAGSQRFKCLPCPFPSYPAGEEGRLPFPDWRERCERILKWVYIVVVPLGHVVPNERNSGDPLLLAHRSMRLSYPERSTPGDAASLRSVASNARSRSEDKLRIG